MGQIPTDRCGIHLCRIACSLYFPWHGIQAIGDVVKLIILDHRLMLVQVWLLGFWLFFFFWIGWDLARGRIYAYNQPRKRENMSAIFWQWRGGLRSFFCSELVSTPSGQHSSSQAELNKGWLIGFIRKAPGNWCEGDFATNCRKTHSSLIWGCKHRGCPLLKWWPCWFERNWLCSVDERGITSSIPKCL